MYHVVPVTDLVPERDVLVGLPVETTNKQTFHRVPVRAAHTESASGDQRTRVQMLPGSPHVVQSCAGLPRLLLRFHSVFVPGIKVFEAANDNDRTNLSMGFSLYDHRTGPTPDEERVLQNMDALALFLRSTMVRCDKIRRTLKLGPENMTEQQQQFAAESMDLHVVRPAVERPPHTGGQGQNASFGTVPSRYCYVKLVPPNPDINDVYHTYFWTEDGKRIPFETVLAFRNFRVQPFVEVEDIFVSKAVRSLQLKLRECIVVPPAERLSRFSVCFPERVCRKEEEEEAVYTPADPPPCVKRPIEDDVQPEPKRVRVCEEVTAEEEDAESTGDEPDAS